MITYLITESQVKVLQEKLKPSQFRDYVKAWKDVNGPELYDKMFDGKYRIVLPITEEGEEVVDYDFKTKLERALAQAEYKIKDIKNNRAVSFDDKRETKITRVLSKSKNIDKETKEELKKEYDKMLSELKERERKSLDANKDNYRIVISRHPYDIAGMSTDREWESCMTLDPTSGSYNEHTSEYVMMDIKEGSIIAYMVRKDDLNIEEPLARVLIKPYVGVDTGDVALFTNTKVYGKPIKGFRETVQKWVEEHQTINEDIYVMLKTLYQEGRCAYDVTEDGKFIRGVEKDIKEGKFDLIEKRLERIHDIKNYKGRNNVIIGFIEICIANGSVNAIKALLMLMDEFEELDIENSSVGCFVINESLRAQRYKMVEALLKKGQYNVVCVLNKHMSNPQILKWIPQRKINFLFNIPSQYVDVNIFAAIRNILSVNSEKYEINVNELLDKLLKKEDFPISAKNNIILYRLLLLYEDYKEPERIYKVVSHPNFKFNIKKNMELVRSLIWHTTKTKNEFFIRSLKILNERFNIIDNPETSISDSFMLKKTLEKYN